MNLQYEYIDDMLVCFLSFLFARISYMESETEDSSVGICNGSLGREVMQAVQQNDKQQVNKVKVCSNTNLVQRLF